MLDTRCADAICLVEACSEGGFEFRELSFELGGWSNTLVDAP